MSYCKIKEFSIIPKDTPKIVRNCSKCGRKSYFINSENFRVNANGSALDIWLIYRCQKCNTTYNLRVYDRISPKDLDSNEYKLYQNNDYELARKVSFDGGILGKNRVEANMSEIEYIIQEIKSDIIDIKGEELVIYLHNKYGVKVRVDKILSEKLNISRTRIKHLIEAGDIYSLESHDLNKVSSYDGIKVIIKNHVL